jgi:hypothetical protein
LPHGLTTVPALAAGKTRSLRWLLVGKLKTVFHSKERSQMTYQAPIALSDPCVYNPTHILPWLGPEDGSRNIGDKMQSVYATLEGGGLSNYAFAADHSLRLVCHAETIHSAPARLGNCPLAASASAVAAMTVHSDVIINDSDPAGSDSDSDKKPAAMTSKKKAVSKAHAVAVKKATPRKKPAKVHGVDNDYFVSVGTEKSPEVSTESDEYANPPTKPKPLTVFEQNKNKRTRQLVNQGK